MLGPPKIVLHPVSQLAAINAYVTLKCKGSGIKPLSYHWETRSTDKGPWIASRHYDKRLVFKVVQNTSQIRCMVSNKVGVVTSHVATITVLGKNYGRCSPFSYI